MTTRQRDKTSVTTVAIPLSTLLAQQKHQQYESQPVVPSSSSTTFPTAPLNRPAPRHAPHEPAHVRYYPLDLPSGLPFERYEHRRISTRDILVHRILSKILFPTTRELAESLDQHRPVSYANCSPKYHELQIRRTPREPLRNHNFGPLKQHDPSLARDVEVLRKTLNSCLVNEFVQELRAPLWSGYRISNPKPGITSSLSIEDETLDLIRIYFMETDDAATRLWLKSFKLPHGAPYDTLSKLPAKKGTSRFALHKKRRWQSRNTKFQHKQWYEDDQAHLKSIREHSEFTMTLPRLYDGGSFIPWLRDALLMSKQLRLQYMSRLCETKEVPIDQTTYQGKRDLFFWPEPRSVPRRFLHVPSYNYRSVSQYWQRPLTVEFASGRTGRGLDRDGIWSTSRWSGDDWERGRTGRRQRRRRGVSEPPPGLFMASRLPPSYGFASELLIYPKMSLSTMIRRVRSRSLSRTRIAEMFNWDVVTEVREPDPPKLSGSGVFDFNKRQKIILRKLDMILERIEQKLDINDAYFRRILRDTWLANPESLPDWWLETLDGEEEEDLATEDDSAPLPVPDSRNLWCENCKSTWHVTGNCQKPCGYCGAANPSVPNHSIPDVPGMKDSEPIAGNPHIAPNCPVARHNRCKCVPFPQFHIAKKCAIVCSRDCGSEFTPGHFKHKSAMLCQSRCCMCGMRGHSGSKCKLRHCRCGGNHLGQDCRFHPECRVKGCDRFLCGVHCQLCGMDRAQLDDGAVLVDQKCPACRGEDEAADGDQLQEDVTDYNKHETGEKKRRDSRRKNRPMGPKPVAEEQPWYAPFQPRTRPVVLSKSGKKTDARYHKNIAPSNKRDG